MGPSQPSGQTQPECGNETGNEQTWGEPTELSRPQIPVLGFEASHARAFSGAECVVVGVEMEFSPGPQFFPPGVREVLGGR